jgi:hypothetical protein
MKGRFVGRVAAAATLCLGFSGCLGPGGGWQFPGFTRPPPPSVPATHTYQPSAGEEINSTPPAPETGPPAAEIGPPAEDTSSRSPVSHAAPSAVATPAPPVLPIPTPTVTLGNGPSKQRAQHLLDNTAAKLATVDRGTLGADSANTYDQANNLLQAGRRAATEDDYVAASGFAEKAAALAAKLTPTAP